MSMSADVALAIAHAVAEVEDSRTRWQLTARILRILREAEVPVDGDEFRVQCNPTVGG